MRRVSLLLLFYLFFWSDVSSQQSTVLISGAVYDSETGESLPSATILIDGTYRGTISNPEGEFSIEADTLPVTLQVRYIGYRTTRIRITDKTVFPLQIMLERAVTEMEEIVVTDRDPGLSIMETVIARKQIWRKNLQNYSVDAYTRQVLSNDTSIASVSESRSVLYWDRERGIREIQQEVRQTSNLSADQNFSGVRYLPNFYDDDIEIAGFNMVGITHPDALRYYRYSLIETTVMDDVPVYKIEVIPKRERQPLFEGVAFVHGGDFALLEVELRPNRVVTFPPPVQDFQLSYMQQFSNYGKDFWLPVDVRIEGVIRVGIVGLQFPSIQFRQLSRLSGYEVNTAMPDSVFAVESDFVRADTSATDSLKLLTEMVQIPLTEEEQIAYETIDSTQTLEEAFRPEGFLARMIDEDEQGNGGGNGFLSGLGAMVPDGFTIKARFNRVDGFHAGLGYRHTFEAINQRAELSAGYSFFSEMWDVSAGVRQRLWQGNEAVLSLEFLYMNATDTRYRSQIYPPIMNSIATISGAEDYFDYFRNEKLSAEIRARQLLPYTRISIGGTHERHRSISGDVLDYSLFGFHKTRRPNLPVEEGLLNSFYAEININHESGTLGFSGTNGFEIRGEWSGPSLGSDFSYLKVQASGELSIPTFYRRRLFANQLHIFFTGGTATSGMPVQRHGAIDGSLARFTPFGSLRTRNGLPYEGSEYWFVTAEHNFRTIPFELLGLWPLVDRGWGIILFGGAGSAGGGSNGLPGILNSEGTHTEAGLSLNSVFGILRIDIAKRLDDRGYFIGVSVPRYF
ncbi:DUF5686 and carboxypeptidase-like regulatory domain-containing protein [Rhodohalobacter mucosus]|uniref:Carboxypeptidase-like regulatory domain-containing protein n=1 Tax=Rhodohalobacter mucosus TaxID=2079485 RepID=A0A316TTE4_9BACT|nr:DUF5686 and carboxypeptidase-like regulatory domain-containing protein [Rhodohalobacter mucosus]PWN07700.1 hypothetical protein DDZ15_01370 [Rhodohalobacter mucosus]